MSTEGHDCNYCWRDFEHGCVCDLCDLPEDFFDDWIEEDL